MNALDTRAGPRMPAASPKTARPAPTCSPRRDDGHSRRVARLKRVLPVIGVALLALVAIWPRLVPLLDSVRFGLPVIDLREAHELRMLNPRYAGLDRFNRPYVVTSAVGRQASNHDDLMSLERPRAEMTMRNGAQVVVTAATAMYQSQAQLLDLFGDVNLIHENGTRFVTNTAHADVAADTVLGNDPVTGHGPSGDITAQGFRVLDRGNTIIFAGTSHLLLKGTKPSGHPSPAPPALPPEVAETAAALEAAAIAPAVVASEPPLTHNSSAGPAPVAPAAKPDPAVRPRNPTKRDAGAPSGTVPATVRMRQDAG